MKKFMTVKEAAAHLRVHRNTIYRLLKSGNLKATKVGKQYRIEVEA